MQVDKDYWKSEFAYPYCPNEENVDVFQKHKLNGSTLLLGCTKTLIKISDYQMDIDPWYEADTVIKADWRKNNIFYDNIISDGALNLDRKLTQDVLRMAFVFSNRFMVRYFNYKLPEMKIADCFIEPESMEFTPDVVIRRQEYSFLVWNFNAKTWF